MRDVRTLRHPQVELCYGGLLLQISSLLQLKLLMLTQRLLQEWGAGYCQHLQRCHKGLLQDSLHLGPGHAL